MISQNPFTLLEYDPTHPINVKLHLTDLCNLKCPWCTDLAMRAKNMASALATGKAGARVVFADCSRRDLCHKIRGLEQNFPESEWAAEHHVCPPICHGYDGAGLPADQLKTRLVG